jgi:hypothetical protein
MKKSLIALATAGIMIACGSAYAQTNDQKTEEASKSKINYQKPYRWDKGLDAGLGIGNPNLFYIGFRSSKYKEDTLYNAFPVQEKGNIKREYIQDLGLRFVFGFPTDDGGLEAYGIAVGGRKYLGETPIGGFLGGALNNKSDQVEPTYFGIGETKLKVGSIDFDFGIEFMKKRGISILVGKQFF